jgi:hypothetical protein
MSDIQNEKMKDINARLGIQDDLNVEKNRKLIFVYSPPKVGSTTLVSSLRLSASDKLTILHLHNEIMLKVLYDIKDVTINEIINYNKHLGKIVYVIDIFRTPIEHKMSSFFENIETFHFNTTVGDLNTYDIKKLVTRFNNLFPHLAPSDHFKDKYEIAAPEKFDFERKYILVEKNGVKYIKLRLKDSNAWRGILREVLHVDIFLVNDYETDSKAIKDVYINFKNNYKIPNNLLENIKISSSLSYYLNDQERNEYVQSWQNKSIDESHTPYTVDEYNLYNKITLENHHMSEIQTDHYMDCGCVCVACERKRRIILEKLRRGENTKERIVHEETKQQYMIERVNTIKNKVMNKINMLNKAQQNNNNNKRNRPRKIIKNNFTKLGTNM